MATNQINLHWLEISKSALEHNLRIIKKSLKPHTQIMAMVKANAYGHGLEIIVPEISSSVDYFCVNTLQEALIVKNLAPLKSIFIAAPIPSFQLHIAHKSGFSLSVPSLAYLQQLITTQKPFKIHLKINTGMNRLGLSLIETLTAINLIKNSHLQIEGVYTHFHSSGTNQASTNRQLDLFLQAVSQIKYSFPNVLAHAANSDAIFLNPTSHLDLVRTGEAIYGLIPNQHLKPVLSWKCHPLQSRQLQSKETVGYLANYKTSQPLNMAILPIGFSDGYDRKLSNIGQIFFKNNYFSVIGNISMNFTTIDTQNILLKPADTLEIIGLHLPVNKIATQIGTIEYETVSRLSPFIPRILV